MSSTITDLLNEFFELEAELVDLADQHRVKRERLEVLRTKLRDIAKSWPTPAPERPIHRLESAAYPGSLSGDF